VSVDLGSVGVAITQGVPVFEFAIPCEVFGRPRLDLADPWYDFRICAAEPGRTTVYGGFVASTPYDLTALVEADTVVVPACEDALLTPPAELVDAVWLAHSRGARILSICTGAFVLAAAGLLDGRRATTHWMHAELLASRYPKVTVDPSVLYIDEGDIMTSAGSAAGLDLCLHVVRCDLGAAVANALARRIVMPPHRPGGQAQYIESPLPEKGDDEWAKLLDWMLARIAEPLSIRDLAQQTSLAERTFIRRFYAVTGTTPLRWLLAQRLSLARELLESTDMSVERIAVTSGLGSAANLRKHFTRAVGVSPSDYRGTFMNAAARDRDLSRLSATVLRQR
jgi:transcriptional regulator GlxA family with amidase domain